MGEEAKITDKDQETTQVTEESNTAQQQPEKTFTQADVDKIVSDRLARERSKIPSADELKAYGEWKKSQQTEAEKAAEREKALAEAQARSEELKRELLVSRAGVKAEDADFVIFKVAKMDSDFEQNPVFSTHVGVYLAQATNPSVSRRVGWRYKLLLYGHPAIANPPKRQAN